MIAMTTTGRRTLSKVQNSSHLLLEEMLTPAPARQWIAVADFTRANIKSAMQCRRTICQIFSPLRALPTGERESFTWEDSAMRVIELSLSLEEDESLSLLALGAPNNSASGEKELRRRRSNAPSADRSLAKSAVAEIVIFRACSRVCHGGRERG